MKFKSAYIVPIGCEGLHIIQTGKWRTRRPILQSELCTSCGLCVIYCPVNSIKRSADGKIEISYAYCKGCGICANECKRMAIHMVSENEEK